MPQHQIETIQAQSNQGGLQFTRLSAAEPRMDGAFLLLVQVPSGSAGMGGQLIEGIAAASYRWFLTQAGIPASETPGWDTAVRFHGLEQQLGDNLVIRTSDVAKAQAYLTPTIIAALVDWVQRFPLQNLRPMNNGQAFIFILIGPAGLRILATPALQEPQHQNNLQLFADALAVKSGGPTNSATPSLKTGANCPTCAGPGLRLVNGMLECSYCGNRFQPAAEHGYTPTGTNWVAKRLPDGLSTMAVVSLIAGIAGWTLIPMLGSLVAIGVGWQALREIRASEGRLRGNALAVIGIVLGMVPMLLLCFVFFLVTIGAVVDR
jgi:hypothetical protein